MVLFQAKTILMGQVAKAKESALSGDGDNPTANVSPTAEETTPNSQVTDTDEREQTRAAEKEILDIRETDPDLLSSVQTKYYRFKGSGYARRGGLRI